MELIVPEENKQSANPECRGLQTESKKSDFPKRKPSQLTKRNLIIFFLIYTIFFIFILILILYLKRCSQTDIVMPKRSQVFPVIYLDRENKPCLYQETRLSKSIIPISYSLYIHPNISQVKMETFTGHVEIECICKVITDFVVVHAKSLKIYKPSIKLGNYEATISVISFCPRLDQFYIKFNRFCKENERVYINLSFNGKLERRLDGFYLSKYKTKQGLEKTLITTHMEPTFARQAFPCFDEPFFKANFTLKMIRDENHYSLFNMPLKSTEKLPNGLYCDTYEHSVRMSTYLVAYMVLPLDYEFIEGYASVNQTKVRIFAPKHQKSYTSFAMEITQKVLPFFENLFGINYPLPKLDMIAIPDFSAGAMENWGLITYRFYTLLLNPKSAKIQHKTAVAKIISHEIAHQWFGNIVTMDWWDDLWLNEGFATYSEYLAGDHINREWDMIGHFYLEQYVDAMNFDSLLNSHPIQAPVKDPQEIESLFDQISYGKGAALVRMLEGVLGLNTLKAGLKIYLQRYTYQTTISDNLWKAFSDAYTTMNTNVKDDLNPITRLKSVMSTWLNQMNFPLVTLTRTSKKSFRLTQERFLLYPNVTNLWKTNYSSVYNYVWSIPILYKTDTMTETGLIWLDMKTVQDYELPEEYKWIKLNVGQTGFFRVNYDKNSWLSLIGELKKNINIVSHIDRSGLLSDAFTLVRAGKLKIDIAMELALYLKNETNYVPWSIASYAFLSITRQLHLDDELKMNFQKFAQILIDPVLKTGRLGTWTFENFTSYEAMTRLVVLQFAIMYQHNQTMKNALEFYKVYKNSKKLVNSNLHSLSAYAAVAEGGKKEWNFIFNHYKSTTDTELQRTLRKALSRTRDVTLINKLLYTMINKYNIQDVISTIYEVSHGQNVGVDQAWLFLQRNWNYFEKNFSNFFIMMDLFKICYGLLTETDYEQAKLFFSAKQLGVGDRSSMQALEMIKSNIFWTKVNRKPLRDWLNQYFKNDQDK